MIDFNLIFIFQPIKSLVWRKDNRINHISAEFNPNEMQIKYLPLDAVAHENSGNPSNLITKRAKIINRLIKIDFNCTIIFSFAMEGRAC